MSFRDNLATLAAVTSLLVGTAACQSDPGSKTPPAPAGPIAGEQCVDDRSQVKDLKFGQDIGAELYGFVLGKGKAGVVLAHQNQSDACQWLPFGEELAERGYLVLLFDFAGFGVSPTTGADLGKQVASAAAALKGQGATTIVLIGASMGGTAVLAAAPAVSPPPAAVISFSAPASFGATSAIGAVPALPSPALLVAGRADGDFPRAAELLHGSAPAGKATLLVAESGEHGWALVTDGIGDKDVREATFAFLTKHMPA
ncbi:MAG TPA: alpha/beta hydrolase [Candidatus Limnocylindrales bacterium]